jgi:hypothetical protein
MYKEITNDWDYDGLRAVHLRQFLFRSENFKPFYFVLRIVSVLLLSSRL